MREFQRTRAVSYPGSGNFLHRCRVICKNVFQNCINRGFLALEVPEAGSKIKEGDFLSVNLERGIIENETSGESYEFHGMPPFIREVCDGGGLYSYIQKRLQSGREGD